MKAASRWKVGRIRNLSGNDVKAIFPPVYAGNTIQQAPRIGMQRFTEQRFRVCFLDNSTGIHDGHTLGDFGPPPKIMLNNPHRQAIFVFELL